MIHLQCFRHCHQCHAILGHLLIPVHRAALLTPQQQPNSFQLNCRWLLFDLQNKEKCFTFQINFHFFLQERQHTSKWKTQLWRKQFSKHISLPCKSRFATLSVAWLGPSRAGFIWVGLTGYIPVRLNPDFMLLGVIACFQAGQKTEKNPFLAFHILRVQTDTLLSFHSKQTSV